MKKIDGFSKWITWHRWPMPKDIIILSLYEFIAYFVILLLFIFTFYIIQRVPVHDDKITAYLLQKSESDSGRVYGLRLRYVIPMTIFYKDNNGHGSFNMENSMVSDSILYSRLNDSKNWTSEMDFIRSQFKDKPSMYQDQSLYHVKIDFYNSCRELIWFNKKKAWVCNITDEGLFNLKNQYGEDGHIISDNYFSNFCEINIEDKRGPGPLSRPSIFSLYDISQSYFNLKFDGNFQKSHITIDFIGATEFSKMYPEPDEISMSHIAFNEKEKIDIIRDYGLSFHAKYVELENLQSSRVFVVSAILSAMIALFLTFIVISIYKIKMHFKKTSSNTQKQLEMEGKESMDSQPLGEDSPGTEDTVEDEQNIN